MLAAAGGPFETPTKAEDPFVLVAAENSGELLEKTYYELASTAGILVQKSPSLVGVQTCLSAVSDCLREA